jgi:uncharacterized protein YecE (DUF72 family)
VIRFGPAGFDYKDWVGPLYPKPLPSRFDRLAFLSDYFDTVEINSSFYGPPKPQTAAAWVERVGHNPRFRFTAKLWRRFTHEREQAWTDEEVDQARVGFGALAERGRLGAVLLQFPWSFKRTDSNEEWLHDVITAFGEFPLVLEVRHLSWAAADLRTTLLERGVGIVNIDQPLFTSSIKPGAQVTSATGYVRLHGRNYRDWFRDKAGRNERYDYLYSAQELEPWAERILEIEANPRTKETYVVTNNHHLGKAPANSLMLQSLVERRLVPAPELLVRAYAGVLAPFAKVSPSSGGRPRASVDPLAARSPERGP